MWFLQIKIYVTGMIRPGWSGIGWPKQPHPSHLFHAEKDHASAEKENALNILSIRMLAKEYVPLIQPDAYRYYSACRRHWCGSCRPWNQWWVVQGTFRLRRQCYSVLVSLLLSQSWKLYLRTLKSVWRKIRIDNIHCALHNCSEWWAHWHSKEESKAGVGDHLELLNERYRGSRGCKKTNPFAGLFIPNTNSISLTLATIEFKWNSWRVSFVRGDRQSGIIGRPTDRTGA